MERRVIGRKEGETRGCLGCLGCFVCLLCLLLGWLVGSLVCSLVVAPTRGAEVRWLRGSTAVAGESAEGKMRQL